MIKNGKTNAGAQRFRCKSCGRTKQDGFTYLAYQMRTNQNIVALTKEGCGIRSIARILNISPTTVIKRILNISKSITKPAILLGKEYEMDEMITFIGNKQNRVCIAYAIERKTKTVVDFRVGKRNKKTLQSVVNSLLLSESKQIRTDRLMYYLTLIPKEIHHVKQRGINYIERKNLTLRTHLKRLNRRSICFSKSILMLNAILKIYFWY